MVDHKLFIVTKATYNGERDSPPTLPVITAKKAVIMDSVAPSILVVSDGTPGMRLQALALGQALQFIKDPTAKIEDVILTPPWLLRHLPRLARVLPLKWLRASVHPKLRLKFGLFLPPTIIVTCGRRMAGLSIAMQRLGQDNTTNAVCVKRIRTIHIQDPRLSPSYFDILIVPQHDKARGPNVIISMASLNRLNDVNIADSAKALSSKWSRLPTPRVAVLLGGSNRRYNISPAMVTEMAERLRKFATSTGTSLALIPSKRTSDELLDGLTKGLQQISFAVASSKDKNPYPGILGIVEATIVTSDSVNLTSEAAITGKPVLIAKWQHESGRIRAFHDAMVKAGHTMPLGNSVPKVKFTPLNEMPSIIRQVIDLLRG